MQRIFSASGKSRELDFMYRIILEAGKILLAGKAAGTEVAYKVKTDSSIVTQIDHECAAFLDGEIGAAFPGDAILNEETYHLNPSAAPWHKAERCWILDPLDSTSSYIRNGQHYGVIMALAVEGKPVAAMTYKPELGEMYFAAREEGAFRAFLASDPASTQVIPVRVSGESKLNLILSHSRHSPGLGEQLRRLGNPPFHRMNGSLKINEVARGAYTGFISPPQNPICLWDLAAPALILEEAGGRITDLQGALLDFRNPDPVIRSGVVASNGVTHSLMLDRLARA